MGLKPHSRQNEPMLLVLITGLPGTGKSTLAEQAGRALGAPVLGHDWAMSGLRPYPEVQEALDGMGVRGHRGVGWSLLWSLARSQLRLGSPVVLDGVARAPEVEGTRRVAREEGAASLVVMTSCDDPAQHRTRVEGRQRQIPNWYELDWPQVARSRESWEPPGDVDLVVDGGDPEEENARRVRSLVLSAAR
jgi:predicted kinase